MTDADPDPDFDPETFDAEKYADRFPQLQTAYRRAFEEMNGRYDSDLVHAIDQQVLAESEPFYEGDGEFRVELPEGYVDRVEGVVASDRKIRETVERYVEELETQLAAVFGGERED